MSPYPETSAEQFEYSIRDSMKHRRKAQAIGILRQMALQHPEKAQELNGEFQFGLYLPARRPE